MDVDWIFRNEVLTTREQRLYVDYVEYDDGSRRWEGPAERAELYDVPYSLLARSSPTVIHLVEALDAVGLLTMHRARDDPGGLEECHADRRDALDGGS